MSLRVLFDERPPYRTQEIDVPGGHRLHVRECGTPAGVPVLLLHGGPGSGCSPLLWRFLDPGRFRVVAPDQRGAGRSRPAGGIEHNTTAELLADLRVLRRVLGIERWAVVGGSWGATLALAHALDEPGAVGALLLRASFLARREDIDGFFRPPAPAWEPAHARLLAAVRPAPGQRVIEALHAGLCTPDADPARAVELARAWWHWECTMTGNDAAAAPAPTSEDAQLQRYRVQAHYMASDCFLADPSLLQRLAPLAAAGIPVRLLHGTADLVCPPAGARALHAALPGSRLEWVDGAGHSPAHPAMVDAMRRAVDEELVG